VSVVTGIAADIREFDPVVLQGNVRR
jgi:hypothetical protein